MAWLFNPSTMKIEVVPDDQADARQRELAQLEGIPPLPADAGQLPTRTPNPSREPTATPTPIVQMEPAHAVPPRRRRAPAKLIVPWTDNQLARVQDGLPARYQLFADLGATLGLREGESFGCCLEDFNDPMTDYRVRQQVKRIPGGRAYSLPKHEHERSIPVPADLRNLINQHISTYGTAPVTLPYSPGGKPRTRTLLLTTQSCTPIDPAYFGRLFTAALVEAGIEATRENKTHMLRHLAASRWIAAGADVLMVSDLLGHADLSTTEAYIRRLKTHDQRTRRIVAKAAPRSRPKPAPALPEDELAVRRALRALRTG